MSKFKKTEKKTFFLRSMGTPISNNKFCITVCCCFVFSEYYYGIRKIVLHYCLLTIFIYIFVLSFNIRKVNCFCQTERRNEKEEEEKSNNF